MRRAAGWALAACALVVAGLALWRFATQAQETPDGAAPVAIARADEASSERAPEAQNVEAGPGPDVGGTADAVARVDEISMCGGQWVKTRADGSIDEADFARAAKLPEARERLLASLEADGSDYARAAAVWFRLAGDDASRNAIAGGQPACDTPACEAARQQAAERLAQARDSLARMAAATSDPRVYALAFNTCGPSPANAGACQLLSADQWARLDPGNATPWLFILTDAHRRRDNARREDALFHIAASTRSDQQFFALPGLVIDRMPTDEAALPAALTLASEAISVEAAYALGGYEGLYDLCKTSTLRDANRRQTCNTVAELLVTSSDTLLERSIGVGLGKRLGWPEERLERLRGEAAGYTQFIAGSSSETGAIDCTEVRREIATVTRHARLGEAGALREWVARSGKTADEFIGIAREQARVAKVEAAAASAAASAVR